MELDGNQYRMIVESSPNMLWRSGKDGLCNYFNSRWLRFTGRTMSQETGTGWAEGVHPDDFDRCLSIYNEAFGAHEAFEMDYRLKRFDGEWRWINDRGVPYYDDNGEFQGFIGSCMDVTERVIGEMLREMAQKDGLTGMNNRQYFEQLALIELESARRYHIDLCMVMADINGFKSINDTYGHLAGDNVLKAFAKLLVSNIRELDIAGRYGGDEFMILLPNTGYEAALILMKRIEKMLIEPLAAGDLKLDIRCSYGIAAFRTGDTLETLVSRADKEMYRMKNIVTENKKD